MHNKQAAATKNDQHVEEETFDTKNCEYIFGLLLVGIVAKKNLTNDSIFAPISAFANIISSSKELDRKRKQNYDRFLAAQKAAQNRSTLKAEMTRKKMSEWIKWKVHAFTPNNSNHNGFISKNIANQIAIHWLMTSIRFLFSRAAATRSLSASCLFTAASDACEPGVISTVTLNRGGSERNNFTRIDNPIRVAMLQCGMVGVKLINTSFVWLSTLTSRCSTTCSSSSVSGCSGSLISRIRSENEKISYYCPVLRRSD